MHLPSCRVGIAEESEWCDTARDRSNPSHTNDLEGFGAPTPEPSALLALFNTSCNGRPVGDTLNSCKEPVRRTPGCPRGSSCGPILLRPIGSSLGSYLGTRMPSGSARTWWEGSSDMLRILHPAGGRGGQSTLRWAEVASRLSVPFHADIQFRQLAGADQGPHPVPGHITPSAGSLPPELLRSLVTLLRGWTEQSETCWFAMWDGNGSWWKGAHGGDGSFDDERDSVLRQTPRVRTLSRAYFLMRGALDDVEPLCGYRGAAVAGALVAAKPVLARLDRGRCVLYIRWGINESYRGSLGEPGDRSSPLRHRRTSRLGDLNPG